MKQIIEYIQQTYNPLSVIVYGSYADGTNNLNSDFDALVITATHEQHHDISFVGSIQLDVFVYPVSHFYGDYDCENFIQIFDGQIIADSSDIGKTLQADVRTYLKKRSCKTSTEIQDSIDWCTKMFERSKRCDTEGMFRWHWVLIDSLEIFCDIMRHPYFGPKKSLKWMEENYPSAFECYKRALQSFSMDSLEAWIVYIKSMNETA